MFPLFLLFVILNIKFLNAIKVSCKIANTLIILFIIDEFMVNQYHQYGIVDLTFR